MAGEPPGSTIMDQFIRFQANINEIFPEGGIQSRPPPHHPMYIHPLWLVNENFMNSEFDNGENGFILSCQKLFYFGRLCTELSKERSHWVHLRTSLNYSESISQNFPNYIIRPDFEPSLKKTILIDKKSGPLQKCKWERRKVCWSESGLITPLLLCPYFLDWCDAGELAGLMLLFRALPVWAILRPGHHPAIEPNTDNNNTHNHDYNKITGLETPYIL